MILLADSGSTKTHWCLLDDRCAVVQNFVTLGINPYYQTKEDIDSLLVSDILPKINTHNVHDIFFYGAGCVMPEKKAIVGDSIKKYFLNANVTIYSDMLGVARALYGKQQGIACILGTGSNSCYYNGEEIMANVSPLGYILGDEGSGAVLGKNLIANCFKNQLSTHIQQKLITQYNLTLAGVLEQVYKNPFPNRYLASFVPFLLENIEEPSIFSMVSLCFDAFFVRNVLQYNLDGLTVGFVGSVAFHFQHILRKVASQHNIILSKILQHPMEGLVAYHCIETSDCNNEKK